LNAVGVVGFELVEGEGDIEGGVEGDREDHY
jgi:hypothetical protein